MPKIEDVIVVNLYVVNSPHWFWLFEDPTKAHDNYVINKHVLELMMKLSGCASAGQ